MPPTDTTDATVQQYPDPNAIPFWFTHKTPPTLEQAERYKAIHEKAREFAEFLSTELDTPPSCPHFETQQAFAKLEECVYWAVTAVSRR